jgi:hypothetical protein
MENVKPCEIQTESVYYENEAKKAKNVSVEKEQMMSTRFRILIKKEKHLKIFFKSLRTQKSVTRRKEPMVKKAPMLPLIGTKNKMTPSTFPRPIELNVTSESM